MIEDSDGGAAISTACMAQEPKPIRLGVLNDQSGVYADFGGRGSVIAARMAVEDYGGRVLGRPVEVLSADHQNKPDVASTIARAWFERDNVDAVLDLTTSSVALAVREVALTKNPGNADRFGIQPGIDWQILFADHGSLGL